MALTQHQPTDQDKDVGEANVDTKPKRHLFSLKRLAVTILCIVFLVMAFYFVFDRFFRPEVDSNLTNVKIDRTENSQSDEMRGGSTDLFFIADDVPAEPADPALRVAHDCLRLFRENVRDYTGVMVSQERVRGKLAPEEFYKIKIRNARNPGGGHVPFSVYLKFLKPRKAAGREVIWVDGWNDGRLVAHEGGLLNLITVRLDPNSRLAMNGKRYPITRIGIENMLARIIEVAETEQEHGDRELHVDRSIKLDGHAGTEIKLVHQKKQDHFAYHIAKVFVDDELNIPVGYEGYIWPRAGSKKPVLVERYFYSRLKINVGLTDADFKPENDDYDFP